MTRVLVLGATSGMAEAIAEKYARRGARLYLVGRDSTRMAILAERLIQVAKDSGVGDPKHGIQTDSADLADLASQGEVLDRAWKVFAGFDRAIIAFGILPDERESQHDWRKVDHAIRVNLVSVITLLDRLLERAGRPSDLRIGVFGSVAGDRGRDRVAVYSAAKGGLERYAQALQQRTWPDGPRIVLLKPGWVRTAMTARMPHSSLIALPESAAESIIKALERGSRVAYIPGWWRVVMLLVRGLPTIVFRRTKF